MCNIDNALTNFNINGNDIAKSGASITVMIEYFEKTRVEYDPDLKKSQIKG